MTTNLTTRKGNKMQLNGNLLTGNTFDHKDYIKKFLDGKWNKESKGWEIDIAKLDNILALANSIGLKAE
jgi:hypothetical protein